MSESIQQPAVICEAQDRILVITFNRPDKLNSWVYQMQREMCDAVEAANADPDIDAIVITATGKGFCAGADMNAVFGLTKEEKQQRRSACGIHEWVKLLRRSKPVVAAVNGAAIGIGVTLILGADQIIAAQEAKFGLTFVKMGLVPEIAGTHLIERRLGFGAASRLVLSGAVLSAQEAKDVSLIDAVVKADELRAEAVALAKNMGCNSGTALVEAKQLMDQNAFETDFVAIQQREFEALERCYESPEHKAAVAAFLEKAAAKKT